MIDEASALADRACFGAKEKNGFAFVLTLSFLQDFWALLHLLPTWYCCSLVR